MNAQSILNADMATLARWGRQGLAWWLGELSDMVPEPLRRAFVRRAPVLAWDGATGLFDAGGAPAGEGLRRAEILLPAGLALVREIALPPMARRDLDAVVALEADRIMPLPADRMLLASAPGGAGASAEGASRPVLVAGIARERIAALLAMLADRDIAPVTLRVPGTAVPLDFLPAARRASLLPPRSTGPMVWWGLVALLVAVNLATLVMRDVDHVERLQAVVDGRKPIAQGARRAASRLAARTQLVRGAIQRRQASDPLPQLAAVSAALPAQAWVQRFAWDGRTLRLSGYKRGGVDVVRALRASGRFEDVRNAGSEVLAEIPVGQPFDVVVRPRRVS